METLLAVVGFVTVAVVTPGPNNFIVMSAAARGGLASALAPIAGVVTGSLLLLGLVWLGAAAVFHALPGLRLILMTAGALYLIWLGSLLIRHSRRSAEESGGAPGMPSSISAVAVFQLLNPKAWVLVLTAATAMLGQASGAAALLPLIAMFVIIPVLGLSLWALAGSTLSEALRRPGARRWFDSAMGLLLIASAGLLFV